MSISLTEDFKTAGELSQAPDAVLAQVQRTGRPVVVTADGKPAVVMLPAAEYERLVHTLNLARLLMEGEASIREGKTRPMEEVFRDLLKEKPRAKKVSR
jgi:prevent-host-death family protein